MIHIGFTGTRHGMTDAQKLELRQWLASVAKIAHGPKNVVAHHGDCVGADAEFHEICRELGFYIHVHPPTISTERAYCMGYDVIEPARPYARRNQDIVNATDYDFAAPENALGNGGTWMTIGMARRARKPLVIIHTDGTSESEGRSVTRG